MDADETDLSAFSQGANRVLGSPLRLLTGTVIYVAVLFLVSTLGYIAAGWPSGDAAYMVLLTIFSVGYGEVRPIDMRKPVMPLGIATGTTHLHRPEQCGMPW
jgi:trk system potassium uptake protein TrkA/voltage-gated potassium channel